VLDRLISARRRFQVHALLPITLSFDHAVIDGAPAARFTAAFRSLAETAVALDDPRRTAVQPPGHS
jgi:pyruvate/2-oxoglutarate dehydrogenase complex dihydrolipoamide acyltransferase (E2) component